MTEIALLIFGTTLTLLALGLGWPDSANPKPQLGAALLLSAGIGLSWCAVLARDLLFPEARSFGCPNAQAHARRSRRVERLVGPSYCWS